MLAGAISVEFVGLFIVLYVGIFTIGQLWGILGDLSQPFLYTIKHFLARAVCLIAVPIALYVSIFYIHLTVLSRSGSGVPPLSWPARAAAAGVVNIVNNIQSSRRNHHC